MQALKVGAISNVLLKAVIKYSRDILNLDPKLLEVDIIFNAVLEYYLRQFLFVTITVSDKTLTIYYYDHIVYNITSDLGYDTLKQEGIIHSINYLKSQNVLQ